MRTWSTLKFKLGAVLSSLGQPGAPEASEEGERPVVHRD